MTSGTAGTQSTASQPALQQGSSVIPSLRYADADAAVRWLGEAFGFEEHAIHRSDAGTVVHAEMTWATGMIMFGPGGGPGAGTSETGLYLVVDDIDAHRAQAVAAGAEADPITDTDYGSRAYSVRDLEGNSWHVGTYDPWSA